MDVIPAGLRGLALRTKGLEFLSRYQKRAPTGMAEQNCLSFSQQKSVSILKSTRFIPSNGQPIVFQAEFGTKLPVGRFGLQGDRKSEGIWLLT